MSQVDSNPVTRGCLNEHAHTIVLLLSVIDLFTLSSAGLIAHYCLFGTVKHTTRSTDSGSITHILAYLGEPTKAPPIAPAARGPIWDRGFEARQGTDLSERAALERQDVAGQSTDGCFALPPEFEFDQRLSG